MNYTAGAVKYLQNTSHFLPEPPEDNLFQWFGRGEPLVGVRSDLRLLLHVEVHPNASGFTKLEKQITAACCECKECAAPVASYGPKQLHTQCAVVFSNLQRLGSSTIETKPYWLHTNTPVVHNKLAASDPVLMANSQCGSISSIK